MKRYSENVHDGQDANTNSDLALTLSERGIEVFPCHEKDSEKTNPKTGKPRFTVKSPYTPSGFTDASCDPDQVRHWWRDHPDALVGVVPGQEAVDALVLDLDVKDGKDGVSAFRKLVPSYKEYPFVETPSGGEHIWCARPEDGAGNAEGDLPDGINVRCDAGYVCFGNLPDGTRYESDAVIDILLGDKPFPKMPDAVAKALKSVRKPSGQSTGEADYGKPYSEGYEPVELDATLKAHKPLRTWTGIAGSTDASSQFASLAQTVIEALLKAQNCALSDLDKIDAGKNVHEIMSAFLEEADSDAASLVAEHMTRRGDYSISRLIAKSEPDRAPENVKAVRAVEKLNAEIHSLTERREAKMQKAPAKAERVAKSANDGDEVTDAEAAFRVEMKAAEASRQQNPNYDIKPLLRHLAETGIETRDPIAFEATLARIMTLAKNLGVSGATDRAIKKAYGVERDKLKSERLAALSDGDGALTQKGDVPFTDLVYLPTKNRYIHTPSGGLWTAEGVDEAVAGEAPSVILRQARRVDGVVWDPAEGPIIRDMTVVENYMQPRKGSIVYNSYKPAITRLGNAKKAEPWTDHVCLLYPGEAEEIFDAFAFFVQNPGIKINWAWVQLGSPGIGKDFALQPLIYAVGDHNTKTVSPLDIMKDFDEFKRSQLLIINELTDLGKHSKFALHEQLKPLTAAPPNFFMVNPKYGEKTVAKNVLFACGMSNHFERALYLPADDRRNFVSHTEVTREHFGKTRDEQKSFWTEQYEWMNGRGREHVLAFLDERDVSHFSPGAQPRRTKAWWQIVDFNKSKEQTAAENHQDTYGDWPDAVDIEWLSALATLPETLKAFFTDDSNQNRIGEKMREFGYRKVENPNQQMGRWKIQGANRTIFVHETIPDDERASVAEAWREQRNKRK